MNNPCYHLTGYERKIQVVFLQTKIRTLERVINTSFHCVPNARPHLELALRRIYYTLSGSDFLSLVKILFELLLSIWRGGGEEIQNDIIKYKL